MRSVYKTWLAGTCLAGVGCGLFLYVYSAAAATPRAVPFTFVTVDAPVQGAASTMVVGINNVGDMVGSYNPIPAIANLNAPSGFLGTGFVMYMNGKFVSIPGPGPVNPQGCNPLQGSFANCYFMEVRGINNQGDIVGTYSQDLFNPDGGLFRAFFQKHNGTFTSYLAPGHANSIFQKITDTGLIYGCFHDEGIDDSSQASMHGVINRLKENGEIQNLASSPESSSMNTGGGPAAHQYAGVFYDSTSLRHRAFVVEGDHRTNFDMPGSNLTQAWDMNVLGDVVGVWGNNADPIKIDGYPFHGFLRDRTGTFIDIEYPGSIDTHVFGINDLGQIVGSYVDQNKNLHGFIAYPGDHRAELARPKQPLMLKASYNTAGEAPNVQVAMMQIVPKDKPLLPASQPASHPASHHHMSLEIGSK